MSSPGYDTEDEPERTDHRDPDQWEFYALPTRALEERHGKQKTISLSGIRKLAEPVRIAELGAIVDHLRRLGA